MPVEVINLISDEESPPLPRSTKRRRTSIAPSLSSSADDEVIIVSHTKRGTKDLSVTAKPEVTTIEDDVECVGEQRSIQVLADYPHFRFQCAIKSYKSGRSCKRQRHCQQCFCYVCDIPAAECKKWSSHSEAIDTSSKWRAKRRERIEKRRRSELTGTTGTNVQTIPRMGSVSHSGAFFIAKRPPKKARRRTGRPSRADRKHC